MNAMDRTAIDPGVLARNLEQLEDERISRERRIAMRRHAKTRTWPRYWLLVPVIWSFAVSAGLIATGWYWPNFDMFLRGLGN